MQKIFAIYLKFTVILYSFLCNVNNMQLTVQGLWIMFTKKCRIIQSNYFAICLTTSLYYKQNCTLTINTN